jgi:hypothetical protein
MLLHVARLDVLGVACNDRHVLALFVLQTDLPASEKLWSRLNMLKPWILERSLQLATHNIFKAVVRDDMVMSALVFDRDSLLHQSSFLELVAVDERSTEASLLIRGKTLREVGVHLACGVGLSRERTVE